MTKTFDLLAAFLLLSLLVMRLRSCLQLLVADFLNAL
jgi:hypothetical protein